MATRSSALREAVQRVAEVAQDAAYAFTPATWRRACQKFDISQAGEAVKFFDEHGWVIFRNAFNADEIRNFRQSVERIHQTSYAGDLLSSQDLGGCQFVLDRRILGIAKSILRGSPCYFGDSTASMDVGAMGFHKDNPDRDEVRAPDWRSPYTLVRIGVYLQDHESHSGGLAVRDRSHLAVNRNKGRPLAIPTRAGDLVLWSLRTTHSGYAARLKGLLQVFVPIPVVKVLGSPGFAKRRLFSKVFRPLELNNRLALFVTFGISDEHQARYLSYLQTRQYAVAKWQATGYDQTILDDAEARGVKLISMREQVSNLDISKLHKEHVELPW
jgi:hypothetical protein